MCVYIYVCVSFMTIVWKMCYCDTNKQTKPANITNVCASVCVLAHVGVCIYLYSYIY